MIRIIISSFLLISLSISVNAYVFMKLPTRFLYKRDLSSWKCAQECFNRAENLEEADSTYRRKRHASSDGSISQIEALELQIARSLMDYCSKSLSELTCLETCPDSDVKKQLVDLGRKVEVLACSNLTAAVKTYDCVLKNEEMPGCVSKTCKVEMLAMDLEISNRAALGQRVIPGKEFCSLEDCSHQCMKELLPSSCGEKSFQLYNNINKFANIVQSLMIFDVKPPTPLGILCIDRPLPEPETEFEDEDY